MSDDVESLDGGAVMDHIQVEAVAHGETVAQAMRHHLLSGLIARVSRSAERESFVLRGGMLTRRWVAPLPRPTGDLDYVGDFAFSVEETLRRFAPALEVHREDGLCIDAKSLTAQGIWLDSGFPGVRLAVRVGIGSADDSISIDIGFNDPLVPQPTWIDLESNGGEREKVRSIRPETQVAWKLHALTEMGTSFRPKDLADLWRITSRVELEEAALPPAIEAAFTSRGFRLEDAKDVLYHPHWTTKTTRVRWSPNRTGAGLPALGRVLDDVRERLSRALDDLT